MSPSGGMSTGTPGRSRLRRRICSATKTIWRDPAPVAAKLTLASKPMTMRKVFISYRRADFDDAVARLHYALDTQFGAENVFLDAASLQSGELFPERIRSEIRRCDAFLAVIGRDWIQNVGRLRDHGDFVRLE